MSDLGVAAKGSSLGLDSQIHDVFPALRQRRAKRVIDPNNEARRVLWHAYQCGALSEEELASTLNRLEFASTEPNLHAAR
jgi:hypothetical protein